jgi:hypothetical protein
MWFYVDRERQQRGPVSVDELKRLLAAAEITKRTHLWQEGRAEWTRLEDLAATLGIALAQPPPTPAATVAMQAPARPNIAPMAQNYAPASTPPASQPAPQAYQQAYAPPAFPQQMPQQAMPPQNMPPQAMPYPPQAMPMPQAPAYPNVPTVGGGGINIGKLIKFAITAALVFVMFSSVPRVLAPYVGSLGSYYAKKDLNTAVSDLADIRSEMAEFYNANNRCMAKDDTLKSEYSAEVIPEIRYGTSEDGSCVIIGDVPDSYELKLLHGITIQFYYEKKAWTCAMSAPDSLRPKDCIKIEK